LPEKYGCTFLSTLLLKGEGRGEGEGMKGERTLILTPELKKSYIIFLSFERRELLWQSGLGLMDLEELVEIS
jgi:hypothetical protein